MKKQKNWTVSILSESAELGRRGLTDGRERSKLQNKQRRCCSGEQRRFLFDHILFLLFSHREGPGASTPGPFLMTLRLCTTDFIPEQMFRTLYARKGCLKPFHQISLRPSSARMRVASSAYSRWLPTGMP